MNDNIRNYKSKKKFLKFLHAAHEVEDKYRWETITEKELELFWELVEANDAEAVRKLILEVDHRPITK
jgi:hypothetical protein